MPEISESSEQQKVVSYFRTLYPWILIFAIPNGGLRNPAEAARLKKEGVLAGVADLFIAEPRGNYHGLFLEMKKKKGSYLSVKQKDFRSQVEKRGYKFEVGRGFLDAKQKILAYLVE